LALTEADEEEDGVTTKRVPTEFSYSSAVAVADTVFLGPHRGFGDSFVEQLDGAFEAVRATLAELGLAVESLVKVNVWLKNISDLPEMEKRFFDYYPGGEFPARMTATTEFIDADCMVMIDGIAHRTA
jgi:2-iminobutanoate/2-iminopropanoate deaminase